MIIVCMVEKKKEGREQCPLTQYRVDESILIRNIEERGKENWNYSSTIIG